MADSLVFLTEPDAERRKAILAVLHRLPGVSVSPFDSIAMMRRAMRSRKPRLVIGPWAQGGETLLAARGAATGTADPAGLPLALVLTDRISPSRISLARQAGNADLIPCEPFDEEAFSNRVTLLLQGMDALCGTVDDEVRAALENLPALRRRLAA